MAFNFKKNSKFNLAKSKRDLKVWAFMDYCICSIDDLMESYKQRRIPLNKAHKYFCELIQAVDYLHSNNIVHKDIKTGNLKNFFELDHLKRCNLDFFFNFIISFLIEFRANEANILLTVSDHVKLTDLGVCEKMNIYKRKCISYKTNGSFVYQSPEMFDLENNQFPAFPIDVWACGVTLYFMTTGNFVFFFD